MHRVRPAERDELLQEPERHRHLVRDVVLPGGIAGLLGGLAMLGVAMAVASISGEGPWLPARLVAGVFERGDASGSAWAVWLGLASHLAIAGGLGTLFALLLPRGGTAVAALGLGVLLALCLQATMPELLVPYTSRPLARWGVLGVLFPAHVAFGAALALVPALRRGLARLDRVREGHPPRARRR